jgi:hypothetical protein
MPAWAATHTVTAPSMRIAREGNTVVLTFSSGLRVQSSDSYTVSAGAGKVVLRSAGFKPLADSQGDAAEGSLPRLPRAAFSSKNVRLMEFRGGAKLISKEYEASAGSLSSGDGGGTWKLAGGVEFKGVESGQYVQGKSFTFAREAMILTTTEAIELGSFAAGKDQVSLQSRNTTIRLKEKTAALDGGATFSLRGYSLVAEKMSIDLGAGVLKASGSPKFVGRGSELFAREVEVHFVEGEARITATELEGSLALELEAGAAENHSQED